MAKTNTYATGTATRAKLLTGLNAATNGAVENYSQGDVADLATIRIGIACSDETTDLTTGTAKATFRVPRAMTLTVLPRASLTGAATGANLVVDINKNGASILSTKLSIDATEKTSTTAATPAVLSVTAVADDDEITIDIDQVGSTAPGKGLKVWLIGVPA